MRLFIKKNIRKIIVGEFRTKKKNNNIVSEFPYVIFDHVDIKK